MIRAMIAVGKNQPHRFRGRLYQRRESTYEGVTLVEWQTKSWRGWYTVSDNLARECEQDFWLDHEEAKAERDADSDGYILSR